MAAKVYLLTLEASANGTGLVEGASIFGLGSRGGTTLRIEFVQQPSTINGNRYILQAKAPETSPFDDTHPFLTIVYGSLMARVEHTTLLSGSFLLGSSRIGDNAIIDQQVLWLQYLDALSAKVTLQAGEALQATYPFVTWDWGGRNPLPNSYSYDQWSLLNVVPSNPYQNIDANAASSQQGFDTAYQNWFNTLAVGNLEKDTNYQQLQDNANQAAVIYQRDYNNAQNLWRNQTGGTSPTFQVWLSDPAQIGIQSQISEDAQDLQAKKQELDDYRQRIETPVNNIVAAFNNTDYQGFTTDPNTGKSVQLRIWSTTPANPFTYVQQITGNNFGGDATKGKADSITMNSSTQTYEYRRFYNEAGAAGWYDFIGVETGGSYERVDMSSFSEEYTIDMAWQDLATIPIQPEAWYAGTNVTSYGAGPYATGFSAYAEGNTNYFFGPGGALSRIYTALIVAYRPTITITAGSSFSSSLLEKWQSEAGIVVGPFLFENENSSETTKSTVVVENGKLILKSQADWPLIVGLKSAWVYPPNTVLLESKYLVPSSNRYHR